MQQDEKQYLIDLVEKELRASQFSLKNAISKSGVSGIEIKSLKKKVVARQKIVELVLNFINNDTNLIKNTINE